MKQDWPTIDNHWNQEVNRTDLLFCSLSFFIYKETFIESTTPRVNPKVNYGLWVTTLCQCRFSNYNKCTSLVGEADNRGGYARVGTGSIWEISVFSPQFYFEFKTALEKFLKKTFGDVKPKVVFLYVPYPIPNVWLVFISH